MISRLSLLLFTILSLSANAQEDLIKFFNADANYYNVDEDALAVKGYDLVEYFSNNKPVQDSNDFEYIHNGFRYLFGNGENKLTFVDNPEKYLPQYGGFCAFGLGMDVGDGLGDNEPGKYPVNPKSFKIIDDKLYLFFDADYFHALEQWKKNEKRFLKNADNRWDLLSRKK